MALTYDLPQSRRSTLADSATDLLQGRLRGDVGLAQKAKFREMDEATGQAGADLLAQSRASLGGAGALGQGAARRNLQTAQQNVLQQVAANKLRQAQAAGSATDAAINTGLQVGAQERAEQGQYLDRLQRNANDIGDSTTAGALQNVYANRGGIGYTDQARSRMDEVARGAASDAADLRATLDRNERERRRAAQPNRFGNILSGVAGGAAAGSAFGPVGSGIGAAAGGLASLFA